MKATLIGILIVVTSPLWIPIYLVVLGVCLAREMGNEFLSGWNESKARKEVREG